MTSTGKSKVKPANNISECQKSVSRKGEHNAYISRLSGKKENLTSKKFPLDVEEAQRSNILLSGTNQVGKTLGACYIADLMMNRDWQVIVFDNSGKWRKVSSIPNFVRVGGVQYLHFEALKGDSCVFDLSLQTPLEQKEWIELVLSEIWNSRIRAKQKKWLLLIFEEFQLIARNVRGNASQQMLRIMSVGANQKIRCLGITCDLALIDPAFIRLCGQRFHFRLGIEENSKRKYKSYYGKDAVYEACNFDAGYCHYLHPSFEKVKITKLPLFKSSRKPEDFIKKPKKDKKKGFVQTLKSILRYKHKSQGTQELEYYDVYGNTEEDEDDAWTEEEEDDWFP